VQGDLMRLLKNRPKCSPNRVFSSKLFHNFNVVKRCTKILSTVVIYKIYTK
jgi:hypothetical protein